MKLIIGDKNLSSWSMRAWLTAKKSGILFEEIKIYLDQKNTKSEILKYSPSEKVPCLIDGANTIWDSLAISEYLAEKSPHLWPQDYSQRALARSYACEMHSGFPSLRSQCSMDIRLRMQIRHLTPSTISEINRILQMWEQALTQSNGPFLFGKFSIADAFFAPVVMRFISYGIQIKSQKIKSYINAIENDPDVSTWVQDALLETPEPVIFNDSHNTST